MAGLPRYLAATFHAPGRRRVFSYTPKPQQSPDEKTPKCHGCGRRRARSGGTATDRALTIDVGSWINGSCRHVAASEVATKDRSSHPTISIPSLPTRTSPITADGAARFSPIKVNCNRGASESHNVNLFLDFPTAHSKRLALGIPVNIYGWIAVQLKIQISQGDRDFWDN